jgi:hypothetical protein
MIRQFFVAAYYQPKVIYQVGHSTTESTDPVHTTTYSSNGFEVTQPAKE